MSETKNPLNKEVIQKLVDHFLEADPVTVARAAANLLLDHHRLHVFDSLPIPEQLNLLQRLDLNEKQLIDFFKNGPKSKFKIINLPPDEL